MSLVAGPNHLKRHRGGGGRSLTTLGVLGLVLGVPLAMMAIHAPPPLDQIRSVTGHPDELRRVLDERVTDQTIAGVVAAIAWLVWVWFVLCVIAEVVGQVRGRTPRVPGSRNLQSLVAGLLGASLVFGLPGRQALPLRLRIPAMSVSAPYIEPPTPRPRHVKRPEILHAGSCHGGTH